MKKNDQAAGPAAETDAATDDAPAPRRVPTHAKVGEISALRVFDADTDKEIKHVLEADTEKGYLVRFEVSAGQFVRVGNDFATVREEIPIRFEWSEA